MCDFYALESLLAWLYSRLMLSPLSHFIECRLPICLSGIRLMQRSAAQRGWQKACQNLPGHGCICLHITTYGPNSESTFGGLLVMAQNTTCSIIPATATPSGLADLTHLPKRALDVDRYLFLSTCQHPCSCFPDSLWHASMCTDHLQNHGMPRHYEILYYFSLRFANTLGIS